MILKQNRFSLEMMLLLLCLIDSNAVRRSEYESYVRAESLFPTSGIGHFVTALAKLGRTTSKMAQPSPLHSQCDPWLLIPLREFNSILWFMSICGCRRGPMRAGSDALQTYSLYCDRLNCQRKESFRFVSETDSYIALLDFHPPEGSKPDEFTAKTAGSRPSPKLDRPRGRWRHLDIVLCGNCIELL